MDPELKTWNSSYNCFENNPIMNIDPDGNTDFYSNGRWIGSDGMNNGLIAIVKDKKIAEAIYKKTLEGHCTYLNFRQLLSIYGKPGGQIEKYNIINKQVLAAAYKVLDQQVATKNTITEHSVSLVNLGQSFPPLYFPIGEGHSGRAIRLRNGERRVQGASALDGVDVSIHGHPLKTVNPGTDIVTGKDGNLYAQPRPNTGGHYDAMLPSSCAGTQGGDKCMTNNQMNIIVGANGAPSQLKLNRTTNKLEIVDTRTLSINIFNTNWVPLFQISRAEAKLILSPSLDKLKFDIQQEQFRRFVQRFIERRRLQQNQPQP